jgi:hypothetical protein
MSEPPKLSEEATLDIRDKSRATIAYALREVADMVREDPSALAFIPPEVWYSRLDKVSGVVVNHALNVAWKDWGEAATIEANFVSWRPTQYAGYFVSDRGEVRGPRGQILRPGLNSGGYLAVSVRRKTVSVHQLVCIAFHGPRPSPDHQVAHGNGVPSDNRAVNLRWATPAENTEDSRRHGTFVLGREKRGGEQHSQARLTAEDVATIRAEYATGRVSLRVLGERFGVHRSHIHGIVTGKAWASHGITEGET